MNLFYLIGVFYMDYDEKLFKAKANIKARRIWLVFALLLTANYGSDVSSGLYPVNNYIIFVIFSEVFSIVDRPSIFSAGYLSLLAKFFFA